MRNRVLWNAPHVRISLIVMALTALLALTGCGGGGGGTVTPTPSGPASNANLAIVTGKVTDTTAAATPISGAVVSIAGTSLKATTLADGTFSIINVPVGTVGISVLTPDVTKYQGTVVFKGLQYDSQLCPITLVTIASGTAKTPTPLAANLQLYPNSAGNGPPAPPATNTVNGCPK